MGFFKDMIKAREEWLKTPRPTPQRAVYLNAVAEAEAQAQALAEAEAEAEAETNTSK
jgi:hypothetical protein